MYGMADHSPKANQVAKMLAWVSEYPEIANICRATAVFEKAETVDSGSEDGVQIVVIGRVITVFRLAVKARCERVNNACFIACVAERPHGRLVIRASHFDRDNGISDFVLFDRLFECQHGELKAIAIVFNIGRLREHVPIEIGEPPCGSRFGTVDGDDAKLIRPDGLHSLLNHALRSAEYGFFEFLRSTSISLCPSLAGCKHFNCLLG